MVDVVDNVREQRFPPLQIEQELSAITTAGKVHRIGWFAGLLSIFVRKVFFGAVDFDARGRLLLVMQLMQFF